MKNLKAWGAMVLAGVLVVGACALMPMLSDLALASEQGKVVEHASAGTEGAEDTVAEHASESGPPVEIVTITVYDGDIDRTERRELTNEERAVVERGREALIRIYEIDPAQIPDYVARIQIDVVPIFGTWMLVMWEPADFLQRLIDPDMEPFWHYMYHEHLDGNWTRHDRILIGGGKYIGSIGVGAMNDVWRKLAANEPLRTEEQALLDKYEVMIEKHREEIENGENVLLNVAEFMLNKLGHHDAPLIDVCNWFEQDDISLEFVFQLEDDIQVRIHVSMTTGQVWRVEYGDENSRA